MNNRFNQLNESKFVPLKLAQIMIWLTDMNYDCVVAVVNYFNVVKCFNADVNVVDDVET